VKPEYLKRELTINSKSFTQLGAECAADGAQSSGNLGFGLSLVLAGGMLFAEAGNILFGPNPGKEAKTFTGEEVLMAFLTAIENTLREVGEESKSEGAIASTGLNLMLVFDVMEKAFGSDKDEQNPREEASADA